MSQTLKKLLQRGMEELSELDENEARASAEALLMSATGCKLQDIYTNNEPVSDEIVTSYEQMLSRRYEGEPTAYITGNKGFWNLDVHVDNNVLVPRPETEHVIETVLSKFKKNSTPFIWDVGTGSGCIAAALAEEFPKASIIASDVSDSALNVASKNLAKYSGRVTILKGNLLLPLKPENIFDLIVANLPYIKNSDFDSLSNTVKHEPKSALLGGNDGTEIIRKLINDAPSYLKDGGYLVLEIGFDQGQSLLSFGSDVGKYDELNLIPDLSGNPRILCMRKKHG